MSQSSGPLSHTLQNQSLVRFSSGATELEQVAYSNTVVTPWIGPRLEVHKFCNVAEAALGQTLTYLIEIVNSGNCAAMVHVLDSFSSDTSLLPNSVLLDGAPLPGVSPEGGIPAQEVVPGAILRIHFQVIIVGLPHTLKLVNQAKIRYKFVTPEGRTVEGEEKSNVVEVNLVSSSLSLVLNADRVQTFVGDIVTYNLLVSNPGFIIGNDARVTIPLPKGIEFLPGSVIVNEIFVPETTPDSGIMIGDVLPEESVPIQFRVQVTGGSIAENLTIQASLEYVSGDTLENVYSNVATLQVIQPRISIAKNVNPSTATPGDTVQYQITVHNEGSFAVDAIVTDFLPPGMRYVEGSLGWNGVKRLGTNPVKGINLGTLTARSVVNIQFEVSLTEQEQGVPAVFELMNKARLLYTFRLSDSRSVQRIISSNSAVIQLKFPIISVYVEVKPDLIERGGNVTFHVHVTNTGSWPARVQLADVLPPGAKWIGEAEVRDRAIFSGYSSPRYLHLGELEPGAEKWITYVAQISSTEQLGIQQGSVTAMYTYEWNGQRHSGQSISNVYTIIVEDGDE
ncbi:hypothetical protein DC345_06310 [Paenibacillus taichungensis]|uniref:DUF11 domain-containing protein n=1 Tax=Paenibacillus taichungensis TaxID=484184 RepID=A0A329QWS1_9BACL|nr:DUF11 domain-containing protein [Paenibacillus taichungensis]RAW16717.1 hypothetical protein DC345_06310 [Paenibacillus taichungensis]